MKQKNEDNNDYGFKILVVGPKADVVSLRLRFVNNIYSDSFISSGVDHKIKTIDVVGAIPATLDVWQVLLNASNRPYDRSSQSLHRKVHACLILSDLSNPASFNHSDFYIVGIQRWNSRLPIVLVGTNSHAMFNSEQSQNLENRAKEGGFGYALVSVKKNLNVQRLFEEIAKAIILSSEEDSPVCKHIQIGTNQVLEPTLVASKCS